MRKITILLIASMLIFTLTACDSTPDNTVNCDVMPTHKDCVDDTPVACHAPTDYSETLTYEMVWNDEFDGEELDATKWNYEVNGGGGGNNELQYYTDQNTVISDGTLKIIAKHETYGGKEYTSSRITTKSKGFFKYGIFEAKMIIPGGTGTWPAFWMMPEYARYGGWPKSGEIDIMEYVGYHPNFMHGTVHTKFYNGQIGTQKGSSTSMYTDVETEFHVYKIEWLPDKIKWFIDDELFYTYDANKFSSCPDYEVWPFNASFFMILNVAIGGDWGGVQGVDDTIFPVQLEVDYIRVYQANELENYEDNSN